MHVDCGLDVDLRYRKILSSGGLLEKLFTFHCHTQSILRIACSRRLSPVLEGSFCVVSVPAARGDIHLDFSAQKVLSLTI